MSQPDLSPEQRAQKWDEDAAELNLLIREVESAAEQRGRLQGLEEAAKIAESITADARWTDACKIIAKGIRELKNTQSTKEKSNV